MEKFIFLGILFFINLVTLLIIKDFKCPLKYHLFSFLISGSLVFFIIDYNIHSLLFLSVLELLLITSFMDIVHYEVSSRIYYLLFLFSFLQFIFSTSRVESILSVFAVFVTFWIFDKFVGIEKLGGADVKIMLILSFYFIASDVLLFVFFVFLFSAFIFIIERIVRKTYCDLQVPMIVPMCLAFFIKNISLYCVNFI